MKSDQIFAVAELLAHCTVVVCMLLSPLVDCKLPAVEKSSQLILLSPEYGHRAWHTMGSQYIIVLGFFCFYFILFWLCWVFVVV